MMPKRAQGRFIVIAIGANKYAVYDHEEHHIADGFYALKEDALEVAAMANRDVMGGDDPYELTGWRKEWSVLQASWIESLTVTP